MAIETARVPTGNGAKYLQQLCKHWSHKLDVRLEGNTGVVRFPEAVVTMTAGDDALVVAVEAKKAAYDAKRGRRGRPPVPPDDDPPPGRQSNLTDPDSALMRRSDAHEFRQAYNAQAVVCANGSQPVLANCVAATTADRPGFAATVLAMEGTIGLPRVVLADTGFASGKAVADPKRAASSRWWRSGAPSRTGPTTSARRPSRNGSGGPPNPGGSP